MAVSDAGLADITKKFDAGSLEQDAEQVLESLVPFERKLQAQNDRCYLQKILPYRTTQNRIDGVVIVFSDITELQSAREKERALELRLQQTKKLKSLGILAGGIAHDFNNMLTSISALAEMGLQEADPKTKVFGRFSGILETCVRSRELVQQIFAFSHSSPQAPVPIV